MLCDYCNSFNHKSKNCDVYNTTEFRQHIILKKKGCGVNSSPDVHASGCINKEAPVCYICFTAGDHFTFDCPDRFTTPQWFLPKIDRMLLHRFFKLFDNIELFSFVRQCRDALNYAKLQPFKVMNGFDIEVLEKHRDSVIVLVFDTINALTNKQIFNYKNVILRVKCLCYFYSECSAEHLLRNFSPYTKIIFLDDLKVTPKIEFYEILARLPQLVNIELIDTNIEIPSDWPQKILKYSNGNLERIVIPISDYDLDIDDLAEIIKTKSSKNVTIGLKIPCPIEYDKWLNFKKMLLSKHFIQLKEADPDIPSLIIFSLKANEHILNFFTLKSFLGQVKEEILY